MSQDRLITAAALCATAYDPPNYPPDSWRIIARHTFADQDGLMGFVAVIDDVAWVVFRGTNPKSVGDLLCDADLLAARCDDYVVPAGVARVFEGLTLSGILPLLQPHPIVMTGHSLGADLACLAARRFGADDLIAFAPPPLFGFPRPRPLGTAVENVLDPVVENPVDLVYGHCFERTLRFRSPLPKSPFAGHDLAVYARAVAGEFGELVTYLSSAR